MRNKRGILGAIFLAVFLVLFSIIALLYYQIKTSGVTISTGNIVLQIKYNATQEKQQKSIDSILEEIYNETEYTSNLEENITLTNYTEQPIDYNNLSN